jgi:hypothetical protein
MKSGEALPRTNSCCTAATGKRGQAETEPKSIEQLLWRGGKELLWLYLLSRRKLDAEIKNPK